MLKISHPFLAALLLFQWNAASASSVILEWDPSTDSDLAGYNVYYQADSSAIPFQGVGATNGAAPINGGNTTTYTIDGLEDDHVYYFAVTAYNSAGLESVYSNIISIPWRPALQYPANDQAEMPLEFDLVWRAFAAPAGTTYTVYYGTDPQLALAPASLTDTKKGGPERPNLPPSIPVMPAATLAVLLMLLGYAFRRDLQELGKGLIPVSAALLLTVSFVGCGPGLLANKVHATDPGTTGIIPELREPTVRVSDWQPNTKYYWKVVAHSGTDEFISKTYSFTTGR
ncbi:MAG: hypothetical protein A2X94_10195 [Bdellovibrionales bacterium GWB1_55_8]|nr:MAG: hypothetical protein A2X94_10195 [Bdellovibrionales bacterium GWB1_55_8]